MISGGSTIGDIGEFGLIGELTKHISAGPAVLVGPGDDAAQIATGAMGTLVSTDLLIENRHFRRDWSSAYEIGRKAAASNLSDINAMGGRASALTVGFAAPANLPVEWAVDLVKGMEEEAVKVGAHIVGGDVSASEAIVIAVTALGKATKVITRDGAKVGDVVAFAGTLGLAAAGYAALSRGFRSPKVAVDAHRIPSPPYEAGPAAAEAGANAMTDVSDGLLADLGHIAAASGVAIDLDPSAFELPPAIETVAEALQADPLKFVLTGGDDYALVATFGPTATLPAGWTPIGSVLAGMGITVGGAPYEASPGHTHF